MKKKKTIQTNVLGGGNFSCRHPKLWKYIKSNVKAFFITGAIVFTITASATTIKILHSRQVRYKNDKSVESAINELYEKASRIPKSYSVGDRIKVNNEYYYVIADSPKEQDYVVALKENPLTVSEVNQFGGVGTANNHVNKYTASSVGTASNVNGYGGMVYYSSNTCGYINGSSNYAGCTTDYNQSDIKYVVDNWSNAKFTNDELNSSTQLINYSQMLSLGCKLNQQNSCPSWLETNYWTMSGYSSNGLYVAILNAVWQNASPFNRLLLVRPVINVKKSAIQKTN